jgi:hypothetical protein
VNAPSVHLQQSVGRAAGKAFESEEELGRQVDDAAELTLLAFLMLKPNSGEDRK